MQNEGFDFRLIMHVLTPLNIWTNQNHPNICNCLTIYSWLRSSLRRIYMLTVCVHIRRLPYIIMFIEFSSVTNWLNLLIHFFFHYRWKQSSDVTRIRKRPAIIIYQRKLYTGKYDFYILQLLLKVSPSYPRKLNPTLLQLSIK